MVLLLPVVFRVFALVVVPHDHAKPMSQSCRCGHIE